MTSDVLNKIKNLRNSSKDLPNFDQLLLLLLVELCGLSAGVYILNYITGKESDINSDSEALDIINDPLSKYRKQFANLCSKHVAMRQIKCISIHLIFKAMHT